MKYRILKNLVDVRQGEGLPTVLMFWSLFLILVVLYLLQPTRDALFLVHVGAQHLPVVYILMSGAAVLIAALYARLSRWLSFGALLTATPLVFGLSFLLFRWALTRHAPWLFYGFYIWVGLFGGFIISQFWLLANYLFHPAQAKRLFGFIGSGAILGAFTGGRLAKTAVDDWGLATTDLLLIAFGLSILILLLLSFLWSKYAQETERFERKRANSQPREIDFRMSRGRLSEKSEGGSVLASLWQTKLLRLLVGIITLTALVSTLVDFQFKSMAGSYFLSEGALTSFFGTFYAMFSLMAFLFQLIVTPRILGAFGVGPALLFLPSGLLLSVVGLIAMPVLALGILAKGSDETFRFSTHKAAVELLFLPLPLTLKRQVKTLVDNGIDRLARGLAGGLLWLSVSALAWNFRQLNVLSVFLIWGWIYLTLQVRKEYLQAVRLALQTRHLHPESLSERISDPRILKELKVSLQSPDSGQVLYALRLLEDTQPAELRSELRTLLRHPHAEIRLRALRLLENLENGRLISEIAPLLRDHEIEVQAEAIHYLCLHGKTHPIERIRDYLNSPDFRIRAAALCYIAIHGKARERALVTKTHIEAILQVKGPEAGLARRELARTLGRMGNLEFTSYLGLLLDDSKPEVVEVAIESAGQLKALSLVRKLIQKLEQVPFRAKAVQALAAYGEKILPILKNGLLYPKENLVIRQHIPRVLALINTEKAFSILLECYPVVESDLKKSVLKALDHLRVEQPDLSFPRDLIEVWTWEEIECYYRCISYLRAFKGDHSKASRCLTDTVIRLLNHHLETIFRLLALYHNPEDMYSGYLGLKSRFRRLRGYAIEFLTNILEKETKQVLLPILEGFSVDTLLDKGKVFFGIREKSREEALADLINDKYTNLKACAQDYLNQNEAKETTTPPCVAKS